MLEFLGNDVPGGFDKLLARGKQHERIKLLVPKGHLRGFVETTWIFSG